MSVQFSAIYASILGALIVLLSLRVVFLRRSEKVGIGHGESKPLRRAIRVHGNAVEYIPIMLILLLAFELNGGSAQLVHGFGAAMVLARLLHAWGLSRHVSTSFGRFFGTLLTYLVILGLVLTNLVYLFR